MRTIRRPASLRWANARSAVGLGGCGLRLADLDQTDGVLWFTADYPHPHMPRRGPLMLDC
jgi:hypothetical protein